MTGAYEPAAIPAAIIALVVGRVIALVVGRAIAFVGGPVTTLASTSRRGLLRGAVWGH